MQLDSDVIPERYRDPVRVGRGAMGDVLRAHDALLDREVAVKLLGARFAEDAEIRARFTREALAAARLSGEPGIVTVYDVGEFHGRPFIVMEYLSGGSLADRIAAGPTAVPQVLEWLDEAARALDAGHRHGVVHRDVKPANLLLDGDGHVHVADFGVASAVGLESLTATGTILGTAGYLSPEQARGDRSTPASDRYALAVVAWELLAGRRPFASGSPTTEAAARLNAAPPTLCGYRRDLPCRELDAVFARALAKNPAARPESARQLVAELRQAIAGGAAPTRVLASTPPARRRWGWAVLFLLLLAAVAAGAVLATTLSGGGGRAARQGVRTVTKQGKTITTSAPAPAASPSAATLTDRATAELQARNYRGAEADAQAALRTLRGSGQLYEAYALYDLGAALAGLGDCTAALTALQQSEQIQGHRTEIDAARQLCAPPAGPPDKGHGKHKGDDHKHHT